MRVLITGQAGTRKAHLAEQLKDHVLAKRGIKATSPDTELHGPAKEASDKEIQYFEVEDERCLKTGFLTFLGDYNRFKQSELWSQAVKGINETLSVSNPKDCLLLLHATFYRNGRFYSSISWDDLLLFKPDCVITLIDDIYDIWQRIEEGPHDTHISLDEILTWRTAEIAFSTVLAQNLRLNSKSLGVAKVPKSVTQFFGPPIPHFVMSVKHPLETFYRLLFDRTARPIVYASFPITKTRIHEPKRMDIDSFRHDLHECGPIVVDPLTIDELRMGKDDPRWFALPNRTAFQEYQSMRWPIQDPAVSPPESSANPFQNLSDDQIRRLVSRIEDHIVDRDFQLVSQCEMLVAYRPFYPANGSDTVSRPSISLTGGVAREINFALRLGRSVWAFHPKCDWHQDQEKDFFNERETFARVRRFPAKSSLRGLPEGDVSGFGELLDAMKAEVKRQAPQAARGHREH